jgi:CheY-like chemotaxis protein
LTGTETILLVDDEHEVLDVGEKLLKQMGYKVLVSSNGKEAVDVYAENKDEVDLVILDMIMPDLGGGETYDRMKETDPDVKVLLSSGYSIDGQASEILHRGCNGFIHKPFGMKELSRELREVVDKN